MLNHSNLMHNMLLISEGFGVGSDDTMVIWPPSYHDMGLIGGIVQPLYARIPVMLLSPVAFLRRTLRWLQALSCYQATISGAPNFAYDMSACQITPERRATLDLSRWSLAFNGVEPTRLETLDRFVAEFVPCGFRQEAFYRCFGLAEATLIVSGGTRDGAPPVISVETAPRSKTSSGKIQRHACRARFLDKTLEVLED